MIRGKIRTDAARGGHPEVPFLSEEIAASLLAAGQAEMSRLPNDPRPIYYVYVLFDWLGNPFYVGKGTGNRIDKHEKRTDSVNWLKSEIIERTWVMLDEIPKIIVRDLLSETAAFDLEIALIGVIGRLDLGTGPLTNMTIGGDGCRIPTAKLSAALIRTYKELGKEWLSTRARRVAESLGEEGRRQRALKGNQTLGKEGNDARYAKRNKTLGKKGLKDIADKIVITLGVEGRKAKKQKGDETLGEEGRKDRARKGIESQTPEQLHERAKLGWAGSTEEERKERGRKIWEARRAKYGPKGYPGGGYKKKS
jgi:hypothetical protein